MFIASAPEETKCIFSTTFNPIVQAALIAWLKMQKKNVLSFFCNKTLLYIVAILETVQKISICFFEHNLITVYLLLLNINWTSDFSLY